MLRMFISKNSLLISKNNRNKTCLLGWPCFSKKLGIYQNKPPGGGGGPLTLGGGGGGPLQPGGGGPLLPTTGQYSKILNK